LNGGEDRGDQRDDLVLAQWDHRGDEEECCPDGGYGEGGYHCVGEAKSRVVMAGGRRGI